MDSDVEIDTSRANLSDLRRFLRHRGLPVSGSKKELLDRVNGARELKIPTLSEVKICDQTFSVSRTSDRYVTPLGEKLPDVSELQDGWASDVNLFPPFSDCDLYNYLVLNDNRTFDGQPINARKQLKAKVFYTDRHLHSVQYHEINDKLSHCYVRAKCIRSVPSVSNKTKENKFEYRVWLCLSKVSGRVHAAGCECDAGEGESCNHVSALMYALVDIGERRKEGLTASTSKECLWNQPARTRKLSPKKLTDLTFKRQRLSGSPQRKVKSSKASCSNTSATPVPINVNRFSHALQKVNPHASFLLAHESTLHLFHRTSIKDELVLGLPTPPFMFRDSVDVKGNGPKLAFENYLRKLSLSEEKCMEIEKATRKQSSNSKWKYARSDRLTSSMFGAVMRRKPDTKPDALLKSILGYSSFDSHSVQWGRSHEPAAKRSYINMQTKAEHRNLQVVDCGIFTIPDSPYLGSSPDGLVNCPHCNTPQGVLEIKCPYKYRMLSPHEAAQQSDFCSEVVNEKLFLKRNHVYYYQIQGQMGITGRKWCDFVIWTLKGCSIERVELDEQLWNSMKIKLQSFFLNHVIPEIFTRRIQRGVSV